MADDYKVPFTKILAITPHSNAERLEIATVYGFNIVVQKDKYKVNDEIILIPIDSVIPKQLEDILFPSDSKIKLHGSRVRQIKIRGFPSQGLLIDKNDVSSFVNPDYLKSEQDLKDILRISKYEPPAPRLPTQSSPGSRKNNLHPEFHEYNGLLNVKWFPEFFKEGDEVIIQEKIHGCVQSKTKIRLSDGTSKTIKEIVDKKLNVKVLGMNAVGNLVETKITNWFNNGKTNKWFRIKTSREKAGRGKNISLLTCTENHKFYDIEKQDYIRADELKIGQKIYLLHEDFDLSFLQKEILIGKMLGDSSLSGDNKNYVSFNQSKQQEEYLNYTLDMLGNIAGNKTTESLSGYGTTMCRARTVSRNEINELFKDWFITGKKEIPDKIKLTPLSIAFWYMDDGSLQHHKDQEDRVSFATCAFSEQSCINLKNSLFNLGIESTIKNYDYNRIFLNADNADKLFTLISSYIPISMQYKLPEMYRQGYNYFQPLKNKYKSELTTQTILEIEKDSTHKYDRYDIETETHNYFANNILTHNSNARCSLQPFQANTLWKKILKFFNLSPKSEFCYGSNRVEISAISNYQGGYYGEDIYGRAFKNINASSKLRLGETIYGEIVGPGIQKNYTYGLKEQQFVLFDVKRINNETGKQYWLNPNEVEEFAKERGFQMVPILYKGPYNKHMTYELTKGSSEFNDKSEKVREGIVIKRAENYDNCGNKEAVKWVSEDYLADKNNTDNH